MKVLGSIVLLACLAGATARAQDRVALVFKDEDLASRPVFEKLSKDFEARAALSRYRLGGENLSNPIKKGRLLADLENRDLVIAVGNGASDFVSQELEDVPVLLVDASIVPGRLLEPAEVSAVFSWSVDGLMDAVRALKLSPVGLAYTPGYESVAALVRSAASERGLALIEKKIGGPSELAPAGRELTARARSLWIVGDPLLARGAGFEFLVERCLSLERPIVGADEWDVRHGALLAYSPDPAAVAAEAESAAAGVISGKQGSRRLRPAPAGGSVLLNGALARRWGLGLSGGARWRTIR